MSEENGRFLDALEANLQPTTAFIILELTSVRRRADDCEQKSWASAEH